MPQTAPLLDGAARASDPEARTFHTLDGLRGLAALAVVVWHLKGANHPGQTLLPSAYMAVDLFFMLSGFVLAYRYDDRLRDVGDAVRFLVMRAIRLYPLYLLGLALGAGWALGDVYRHQMSVKDYAASLFTGTFMLPLPLWHRSTFPFNAPAWSLFYELVVNVLFGFTARWLTGNKLIALIAASMAALAVAVAIEGHMRFTARMPLFMLGGLRALFGFYVGVLLHRLRRAGRLPRPRLHPALIVVLLVLCLIVPGGLGWPSVIMLLFVSFVLFPAIVVAALANEPRGWLSTAMQQLGLLSFPLYAIHFPILRAVHFFGGRLHLPGAVTDIAAVGLSLVAAWLAARMFDAPVRRWLSAMAKRHMPAASNRTVA